MYSNATFLDGTGALVRAARLADGADVIMTPEHPDWAMVIDLAPAAYVAPGPSAADVNAERARRLSLPFTFNGNRFDRDPQSLARITGAATLAGFAVAGGAQPGDTMWHGGSLPFSWITADNTLVQMDAQTMFAFGQAAAAVEEKLIFAAWAIKAMPEIPADYKSDARWA